MLKALFENAPTASTFVRRVVDVANWVGGFDNASAICLNYNSLLDLDSETAFSPSVWSANGELQLATVQYPPPAKSAKKAAQRKNKAPALPKPAKAPPKERDPAPEGEQIEIGFTDLSNAKSK